MSTTWPVVLCIAVFLCSSQPILYFMASAAPSSSEPGHYTFNLKSAATLKCTRCPVNKAFEESVRDLKYKYQVYRVKGRVKWEARSTRATYAQLALRRQNLQSIKPWKAPFRLVLAEFPSNPPSTETKFDLTEHDNKEALNAFWKPGKSGRHMFSQNHIPKGIRLFLRPVRSKQC